MEDSCERDALLTLLLTPGLGPTLVKRCVDAFGSAAATLDAPADALAGIQGISRTGAGKLCRAMQQVRDEGAVERELETARQWGVSVIGFGEDAYPRLLRHIPDPPPVLWVRGRLEPGDALALGMVGSRRCTQYGREQADRFAYACAQAGLCIVSGGAYGIDAAAHRAALRAGGRTIAVLGSGLAKPYPADHIQLFEQIADPTAAHGAVVSEFPMQTPPAAENFPRRNRIISGLSLGVLVIEAALRSGALITARLCVEEHGRELMGVPGRVDSPASEGVHRMLREGWAKLVTNATDVLDGLGDAGQILKAEHPAEASPPTPTTSLRESNLTGIQQQIVEAVAEPRTLDQIAAWTELPIHQVQADLTLLEIRGAVRRRNGLFVRMSQS